MTLISIFISILFSQNIVCAPLEERSLTLEHEAMKLRVFPMTIVLPRELTDQECQQKITEAMESKVGLTVSCKQRYSSHFSLEEAQRWSPWVAAHWENGGHKNSVDELIKIKSQVAFFFLSISSANTLKGCEKCHERHQINPEKSGKTFGCFPGNQGLSLFVSLANFSNQVLLYALSLPGQQYDGLSFKSHFLQTAIKAKPLSSKTKITSADNRAQSRIEPKTNKHSTSLDLFALAYEFFYNAPLIILLTWIFSFVHNIPIMSLRLRPRKFVLIRS